MSDVPNGQKVPDRNHALNVLAADLSELYGWLKLSTRYAAAHAALAVVEQELGLPVGVDLFSRRGPQLAAPPLPAEVPAESGESDPHCSKCGTASCLEDRNSDWYGDDDESVTPGRTAPQPPPSVAPGADTSAVLARLLLAMEQQRWWSGDDETKWSTWDKAMKMVQHEVGRQAATGARAAGGESSKLLPAAASFAATDAEPTCGEEYWRGFGNGQNEERERFLSSCNAERDRADLTELIRNGLLEDDGIGAQYRCTDDGLPADLARWIIDAGWHLPDAPPAPSAPGVAELLAECRRKRESGAWYWASIPCGEIVRLLAPSGGQS